MAISEVFNLDFKFGGNAEFLSRLEALLQRMDARFDSFESDVKDTTKATDKMADSVERLGDSFKEGVGPISDFAEKLKDVAKYYISFSALRSGAERIWSFGRESMEAYSTQERAENQLKGVMRNRGNLDDFQTIKDYAAYIQGKSIYGDEAMIRGAGELATYVKGTKSIMSMMDLLTDYAAGMTGGGEVSPEQMESLATGLGMAYDGNYMAMRRKGFDTSKLEALDAIVENGGVWGAKEKEKYGDVLPPELIEQIRELKGVTEEMRIDALKESLKDWKGLSDEVNKLDSSALVKFQNRLSDMREEIGQRLYPSFNKMLGMIEDKMPSIEAFYNSLAGAFDTMTTAVFDNLETLSNGVQIMSKGVSFLANWYKPLIATVAAMKLVPPALRAMAVASQKVSTDGFGNLAKSLVGIANPAALAGTAIVGLASVMWNVWDKSMKEQHKRTRDISSGLADEKISEYKKYEAEFKNAKNPGDKRGAYEKMQKAKADARTQVDLYAQSNNGYAKEEWGEIFPEGVRMTGYNGQDKGAVKFGYGNDFKNPFDKGMLDEFKKILSESKTEIHNTYNTTNINNNQRVNVAAEVEKIGMLLNYSTRAAIEQAMRLQKNKGELESL